MTEIGKEIYMFLMTESVVKFEMKILMKQLEYVYILMLSLIIVKIVVIVLVMQELLQAKRNIKNTLVFVVKNVIKMLLEMDW